MVIDYKGRYYNVEPMSIALNAIAFTCLAASIFDGIEPAMFAMSIFIYDTIRYPYENILEIEPPEGADDVNDGDGTV